MRLFLQRYETTPEHNRLLNVVADELFYPLFNAGDDSVKCIQVRLICSESGCNHTLTVSVPGMENDPLLPPYLDSLNLRLLEKYAGFIFSKKTQKGWEICIQM